MTGPDYSEGHDWHDQPFPERQQLLAERDALRSALDRVVGSGIWTLDTILKSCWHVLNPETLLAQHVRKKIETLADLKETHPR